MNADLAALQVGVPMSAYRVQIARAADFGALIFDKVYEVDEKFRLRETRLPPGRYWFRVAIIDLLGVQTKFSEPRAVNYGVSGGAARDLSGAIRLAKPAADETVSQVEYRVSGQVLAEGLTVTVNGAAARRDEAGNFSLVVRLREGVNEIRVRAADEQGNSGSVLRRVTLTARP